MILWLALAACGAGSAHAQRTARVFVCPMHNEVRRTAEGNCPRCGMRLVATWVDDFRRYSLSVETRPSPVRAGQPAELTLWVRDPSGAPVRAFVEVHERPFHLFVVSEDLSSFQHIHPVVGDDGRLTVSTTLPSPGRYQLIADFFPDGGTPQQLERAIVTAQYTAPLAAAHLVPDAALRKVVGGVEISLTLVGAKQPVAGKLALFDIRVTDLRGEPVALERYLGAWAHVLMVHESLREAIHAHAERITASAKTLRLDVMPPVAGVYRAWVQVQRDGEVLTAPFTFAVATRDADYLP